VAYTSSHCDITVTALPALASDAALALALGIGCNLHYWIRLRPYPIVKYMVTMGYA